MNRKQRSSPYPSYTIEYCVELVTKIYSNFGSGNYYAKREEIATVLGISAAHLQTQISSANQYGLVDLKQGEGYKPSPLFLSIYRPTTPEEKQKAFVDAFKSPPLYSALIEKFEGEILPSETPLSNILLHHHNISEGANEKAASVFIENAKNLGLLNHENVLKLNGEAEEAEVEDDFEETDDNKKDNKSFNKDKNRALTKFEDTDKNVKDNGVGYNDEKLIPFNIPLKGKRTAQIIVPSDVKNTDFDFIINFVNLMKQQFD